MSLRMDMEEFFKTSIQNYLLEKLAELEVKLSYQDDENYNFNILVNMIKDFITFSIKILCLNQINNFQKLLFEIINDTFVSDLKESLYGKEKKKWGNKLHEFELFTRIMNLILFFELSEDTIQRDILKSYKKDIIQLLDILLIKMNTEEQNFQNYFEMNVVELFKTSNNSKAHQFLMEIIKEGGFDNEVFNTFEELQFSDVLKTPIKIHNNNNQNQVNNFKLAVQMKSIEKELLESDKENQFNQGNNKQKSFNQQLKLSPKTHQIKKSNTKVLSNSKLNIIKTPIKKSGQKNKVTINAKLLSKSKQINQLKKYYTLHKSKLHMNCQSKRSNLGSQQYCKIVKARQPNIGQLQSSFYYCPTYAKHQFDYNASEYYLSENSTFPDISTEKAWHFANFQSQQCKLDNSQNYTEFDDQVHYVVRRLSFENNVTSNIIALNTDDEADDIIN